jgi:TetR/AcrR family transcriptional regulator, lmrAB and yxaGH operons repressor
VARDTRERLIRTTARLLRQQGYAATGLNQVVAEAEAPKGSMYFHFPGGKEELAAAAIDRFAQRVADDTARVLGESDSVAEAFSRFVDGYVSRLERTDFRDGCAVANVSVESPPDLDELAAATGRALRLWTSEFTTALEAEGHPHDQAHRLATLAIATLEGAVVMAKGERSVEPLRAAREALLPLFAAPAPSGARA